jgi:hypothetical protein
VLLGVREQAVEHDDDGYRDSQGRHPCQQGERGGHPQQHREEVGEL